jgi:hypothetical protein
MFPPTPHPLRRETEMEKEVVQKLDLPAPALETPQVRLLNHEPSAATLEVGPGDFEAAFSLANSIQPCTRWICSENLFFRCTILIATRLFSSADPWFIHPTLRRKGLEGEVKLLVQINEQWKGQGFGNSIIATHPDFVEASRKAAEGSVYEAPTRNGKPVKVEFYLPVLFSMLK